MPLHPSDLNTKGYSLLECVKNEDIIPFVKLYLKKKTFFSRFHTAANMLIVFALSVLLIYGIRFSEVSLSSGILRIVYGFGLAFLLIPLHEYIHVLAFRKKGAVHTSYEVNLRKFYFLAVADQFVADKRAFRYAALAPFVVISILLVVAALLVSMPWSLTLTGCLLLHTAFCSGDFGLLSYFDFHKDKEVVTYDNKAEKCIYFYARRKDRY